MHERFSRRGFLSAAAAPLLALPPSALAPSALTLSALTLSVLPARAGAAPSVTPLDGAGSSFIDPVMRHWAEQAASRSGPGVTYTAIGTGTAQSRFLAGDLDFAAVEIPLPAATLADGNLIQFPVAFGALVCVVNIPGIAPNQLTLSGALLAAIYAGGIRTWNDPRLVEANPGLTLPDLAIRPIHLGEPGGAVFSTTHALTQYLLATNPAWREKYGNAITRRWAVGSMVGSAALMVETLKLLSGGIGYAPLGTAAARGLTTVGMRNAAGAAVVAGIDTLRATVARVDWTGTPALVANALDRPGREAWPMVLPTYALIQRAQRDPDRGAAVRSFFRFALSDGAEGIAARHAVPPPPEPRAIALDLLGVSRS